MTVIDNLKSRGIAAPKTAFVSAPTPYDGVGRALKNAYADQPPLPPDITRLLGRLR